MAINVTHSKVSTIPDGDDTSLIRPSDWNDDHVIAGLGTMAEQNANAVAITGGTISGVTLPASNITGTVTVPQGGTGATTLTGYVKGTGTTAMTASSTIPNTDITGLGTASTKDAGVANGVATLDGTGKVPISELPASVLGALSYQGTWNASTNTPTLTSSVGTKGYYYVVNVAGTTDLNGITDWQVGDWAVYNGTAWQKVDNTDAGGDVVGPASATDNALARFDGTTGRVIQNSVVTIDDTGNEAGLLSQQFSNGSAVTLAAGKQWYDGTTGSWNLGMGGGNITQQVGEELFVYGKASAAITDSPLQIVYHTGVVGASGVITFAPTVAGITDENAIIGVATENIALNGFGRITTFGVVRNITTNGTAFGETWADDDVIWYNPVTGNPTNVKPSAPNIKFQIGLVIKAGAGGSGSFQVALVQGTQLGGTDSNVKLTTPTAAQILTYSTADQYWKNTSLASGTGISTTTNANGTLTVNNTGVTSAVAGTGISVSGATGAVTITNTGVTSVSGTSPVVSSGGATPAISMAAATTSVNGYLTSTDWNTFNNKASTALATATTAGLVELGDNTVQTVAANAVTATASRSYALQLNAAGQGVINVPWTNSGGTVTSVGGTGTVNGLTLTGTVTTSGNLTLGGTLSGIANSATTATALNTASAIVARDASGNFAAGTITATLSGNATTATTATTANALNTSNSYTGVNFNATGYFRSTLSNAGIATPTNYSLQTSGSFGGGLSFADGAGNIGLYSTGSGANLNFAFGASGSMAGKAYINSSGLMSANGGFQAESTGPFFLNATTVSANYTIPTNYNASSAGPITVNTGVTVTVSTGSAWVIV